MKIFLAIMTFLIYDASTAQTTIQGDFALKNVQTGKYVRIKGSGLYLTPADTGGETNSSILLQPKKDGDLQRWTLIEQHPTM